MSCQYEWIHTPVLSTRLYFGAAESSATEDYFRVATNNLSAPTPVDCGRRTSNASENQQSIDDSLKGEQCKLHSSGLCITSRAHILQGKSDFIIRIVTLIHIPIELIYTKAAQQYCRKLPPICCSANQRENNQNNKATPCRYQLTPLQRFR